MMFNDAFQYEGADYVTICRKTWLRNPGWAITVDQSPHPPRRWAPALEPWIYSASFEAAAGRGYQTWDGDMELPGEVLKCRKHVISGKTLQLWQKSLCFFGICVFHQDKTCLVDVSCWLLEMFHVEYDSNNSNGAMGHQGPGVGAYNDVRVKMCNDPKYQA